MTFRIKAKLSCHSQYATIRVVEGDVAIITSVMEVYKGSAVTKFYAEPSFYALSEKEQKSLMAELEEYSLKIVSPVIRRKE